MRRCSTRLSCSPHSARSTCNILSLIPTVTAGWSSRFLRMQSAGTGRGRTPASPLQEAHGERDLIGTSYTGGSADREPQWYQGKKSSEDQSSQIMHRPRALLKALSLQIHPILSHSKATVPLFEFDFFRCLQRPVFFSISNTYDAPCQERYTPGSKLLEFKWYKLLVCTQVQNLGTI